MIEVKVGDSVVLLKELHLNLGSVKHMQERYLPDSFPAGTIGEIKSLDGENLAAVDFGRCTAWARKENLRPVKDLLEDPGTPRVVLGTLPAAPDICPDPAGNCTPETMVHEASFVTEGAQHLAAALEEIARLQAQLAQAEAERVVCGYRFNTYCMCALPASRVLKDGEVAVGVATMTAYRSALSLAEFASEHEIDATWRVSFQSVREHFGALRAQGKEGAT